GATSASVFQFCNLSPLSVAAARSLLSYLVSRPREFDLAFVWVRGNERDLDAFALGWGADDIGKHGWVRDKDRGGIFLLIAGEHDSFKVMSHPRLQDFGLYPVAHGLIHLGSQLRGTPHGRNDFIGFVCHPGRDLFAGA